MLFPGPSACFSVTGYSQHGGTLAFSAPIRRRMFTKTKTKDVNNQSAALLRFLRKIFSILISSFGPDKWKGFVFVSFRHVILITHDEICVFHIRLIPRLASPLHSLIMRPLFPGQLWRGYVPPSSVFNPFLSAAAESWVHFTCSSIGNG